MKKVTLLSAIFILAISSKSFSQKEGGDYKPFKVDLSLGYASPTAGGDGAKGGILFAVEPKYSITDVITVGLRMEGALLVSGVSEDGESADAKLNSSYLATGDYYFMPAGGFRAFAGLGAGIYQVTAATITVDSDGDVTKESKFGGMIRAGVEYKHARFGIEYNLIGKTKIEGTDYEIKNGYLGVKFGVLIGGGAR